MGKYTYGVTLLNRDCAFDFDEFESLDEAIDWASGRGGSYVVLIGQSCNGAYDWGTKLYARDNLENGTQFSTDHGNVSVEKIKRMFGV